MSTKIEWCHETWNVSVGCSRVSAGCDNCYAMRVAHRGMAPAHKGLTKLRGKDASRPGVDWNGTVREVPEALGKPLRWKKARRAFVNSMSDLFHPGVSFEFVATVFGVMAVCSQHTFLVLTKRPERAREFFRWYEGESGAGCHPEAAICSAQDAGVFRWDPFEDLPDAWPLPNVHLGVSVEDQATADERIPVLLDTPAAVRWVSYEPALERVYFSSLHPPGFPHDVVDALNGTYRGGLDVPRLDWIVIGGESGPGARPFDIQWARKTIQRCKAAGVPVFVKQGGASNACEHDRKGGCLACMPEDLRVREYPGVRP